MYEMVNRSAIKEVYRDQNICFPMIMGVIEGNSEGIVYCDDLQDPQHIFVKNKFGFCQEFFEKFSDDFFCKIVGEVIEDKHRSKLRMYMPTERMKNYLAGKKNTMECERVHFKYSGKNENVAMLEANNLEIKQIFPGEGIFRQFINRYYKDERDFMENAMPVVAYDEGKNEIGIIYNAAKGDGNCEIDIWIEEQYRRQGIGKALVHEFIRVCQRQGFVPNWDCYSNNIPSMKLAECCGFEPVGTYCFYNIDVFTN